MSSGSQPLRNEKDFSSLVCEADVLVTASFNPKYDPIIFERGGRPKFPIVAESVPHKSSVTCVGVDDYAAGFKLGQWAGTYVLKHYSGKANVLDLGYHLPNTEARSRGFLEGLADTIPSIDSITSLNPQSRHDLAYQLTRDALEVNAEINIIFAINDTNAWGAIQACIDLQVDPQEIIVISFGLEGDTIKNALKNDLYCKVSLAMFPEIVGQSCIDAAILAYLREDLPDKIETPYALLTKESLTDFYTLTETGWQLRWENVIKQLDLPLICNQIQSQARSNLPDCIGILVPFTEHEWYQHLIVSMKTYASESNIHIEVLDAEQNLKDELEFRNREIARRAAQEIVAGDVVFIDGGIVTQYLVEFIKKKTNITVITNSTLVFDSLENNPEITLLSTGGVLRRDSHSLVGPTAEGSLADMRVDKLFLTVSGVSFDFGLSHTGVSEVTIKKAMIHSARRVILLADHTKFDQESFIQIAPLNVVDILITDSGLPASSRLQLNTAGIDVIITQP
ncbi:MAG: substrate-binding domain-containing protein [Anaerolineales bacterium]|nr:substrate-binding domain-containing protein [Anaerolineales bacterium]